MGVDAARATSAEELTDLLERALAEPLVPGGHQAGAQALALGELGVAELPGVDHRPRQVGCEGVDRPEDARALVEQAAGRRVVEKWRPQRRQRAVAGLERLAVVDEPAA